MRTIIDMKPLQGSGICTISCISNVLSYYGDRISEYEVYLLVNGFQANFYNGYVSLNTLDHIDERLKTVGGYETTLLSKAPHQLDTIVDALGVKEPVIMQIDSSYLTFDERLHKEHDFIRTLIIYGMDLEKKTFFVYDTLHLDKDQQPEVISFEASMDLLLSNANELLIIDRRTAFNESFNYKQLLIDDLTYFLDNRDRSNWSGMKAIIYHMDYVEVMLQQEDITKKFDTCYYVTNTFLFGTFIPMSKYLIEAIDYVGMIRKEEMIAALKVRCTQWNILSNKALKLTVTKRENQATQFIEKYRLETQRMLDFLGLLLKELLMSGN